MSFWKLKTKFFYFFSSKKKKNHILNIFSFLWDSKVKSLKKFYFLKNYSIFFQKDFSFKKKKNHLIFFFLSLEKLLSFWKIKKQNFFNFFVKKKKKNYILNIFLFFYEISWKVKSFFLNFEKLFYFFSKRFPFKKKKNHFLKDFFFEV